MVTPYNDYVLNTKILDSMGPWSKRPKNAISCNNVKVVAS